MIAKEKSFSFRKVGKVFPDISQEIYGEEQESRIWGWLIVAIFILMGLACWKYSIQVDQLQQALLKNNRMSTVQRWDIKGNSHLQSSSIRIQGN